jgi:hypothetical protein
MRGSPALKKEKKTFSLSRDAVNYLEDAQQETRKSASQILEELIVEKKLQAERARISTTTILSPMRSYRPITPGVSSGSRK